MDEVLLNRSRGFAEGVVVMICPVLLALALDKVDLNGSPIAMLAMAGVTLISGICPVLACCFYERFPGGSVRPAPVTATLATLSSSCLVVLACWIAQLVVSKPIVIAIGVVFGACVLARVASYYRAQNAGGYTPDMHIILDESHEFLTGVTGIHFLGLEGLALESHNKTMVLRSGPPVGTISFVICALGVFLMFLEMIPPPYFNREEQIVGFTLALDSVMATGTFILLLVVMLKLMGCGALALFLPPVVIIGELVYRVAVDRGNHANPDEQESRLPASLELTRVTFTGFLAVSVTAISKEDSPNMLTGWFLLFAAAAIVFGLSWRLLSQMQIRRVLGGALALASDAHVASSASLASLCAHFCIVVATILFVVMAGKTSGK